MRVCGLVSVYVSLPEYRPNNSSRCKGNDDDDDDDDDDNNRIIIKIIIIKFFRKGLSRHPNGGNQTQSNTQTQITKSNK